MHSTVDAFHKMSAHAQHIDSGSNDCFVWATANKGGVKHAAGLSIWEAFSVMIDCHQDHCPYIHVTVHT